MWWECSECGGYIERDRPPAVCRECGTAGSVVPTSMDEAITHDPEADSLRAVWVRAGMRGQRAMEAA